MCRMRVYMCVCIILHFPTSVSVYGMRVCVYIAYTRGASVSMGILAFPLAFRCVYACVCCMRVYEYVYCVFWTVFILFWCSMCVYACVRVGKVCVYVYIWYVYICVSAYFKNSLRNNGNSNAFAHSYFIIFSAWGWASSDVTLCSSKYKTPIHRQA